jgi:hypothetical protein
MLNSIAVLSQTPMNKDQSKALVTLLLMDDKQVSDVTAKASGEFIVKLFKARCHPEMNVDDRVCLFLSIYIAQSPGELMLYLHAIYVDAKKCGLLDKTYTLDHLCLLFDTGFPNREELSKAWDAQKRKRVGTQSDNSIDDLANW